MSEQQREVWFYRAGIAWLSLLVATGLGAALYFALWITLAVIGVFAGIITTMFAVACVADGPPAKQKQQHVEVDRSHIW